MNKSTRKTDLTCVPFRIALLPSNLSSVSSIRDQELTLLRAMVSVLKLLEFDFIGLHAHRKVYHRPNRPFKCKFCSKDFKDRRNRRQHEEYVHTIPRGVKPFSCEQCEAKFRQKSGLITHRQKYCPKNRPLPAKSLQAVDESAVVMSISGNEMEVESEIVLEIVDQNI